MFNQDHKSISLRIALVLMLITGVFGVIPARASAAPANETVSAPNIFNEDGALKLDGSAPDSFQAENWDVQLDPERGPIFSPKDREALSPLAATTSGNWSALGSNLAGTDGALSDPACANRPIVNAIAVSGTNIYVGGCFLNAGGDPTADYIAKWDTLTGTWSGLGNDGAAIPDGALKNGLRAIAVNGTDVYVGGVPTVWVGGAPAAQAKYLAKWNGTTWSWLSDDGAGGSSFSSLVTTIAISGNNVYVGGTFTNVKNGSTTLTEADYIAKWDGSNWSALGNNGLGNGALSGSVNGVEAIATIGPNIYVGGGFNQVNNGNNIVPDATYIAKWDGYSWSALGSRGGLIGSAGPIASFVNAITAYGTDLYVAGQFTNVTQNGVVLTAADHLAKWDGSYWSALGSNGNGDGALNASMTSILVNGSTVYVAGGFIDVNNNGVQLPAADYVAKWNGTNWSALGSNGGGDGTLNTYAYALGLLGDELFVGGEFTDVNNNGTVLNTADYIAAYDTCTSGSITVLNTNDSGTGSLRQAIADICSGGTINFDASLSGQTITLSSTLVVDKDVTIDGSALNPKITISGNNTVGVMQTKSINGITLDNLSIKDGNYLWGGGIGNIGVLTLVNCVLANNNSDNNGGGITNFGELTLINSTISGNTAASEGGGIYNDYYIGSVSEKSGEFTIINSVIADNTADYGGGIATHDYGVVKNSIFSNNAAVFANGGGISTSGILEIFDSAFTSNTAEGDGGGIYNGSESTLTITNSTFSENSVGSENPIAGWGGAIFNSDYGVINVTNSTFVKNSAGSGGAIFNYRNPFYTTTLTITNSTFSENSAVKGGGIYNMGTLNITNSILANSTTGSDCFHDDFNGGIIGININNLIETNGPAGYQCGTPASSADPKLGPLANNGGLTQTTALLAGSPAIDAGNDANCPDTDQRGVTRPQGSHCDIGAYEYYVSSLTITLTGKVGVEGATLSYVDGTLKTVTADGSGNYTITVPNGWNGTVTPSKSGYLFAPAVRNYSTLTADKSNQNYNLYNVSPADFNGDGKTDVAVFRPSNSTWYISGQGATAFGQAGDIPVPADYNGDGKDDIAVFRPSNSTWYINGIGSFGYGQAGDIPVVADYNGDGKDDIAVFRPGNSTWYIYGVGSFGYGTEGDIPVVADYNGDGKTDVAVFRPTNSTWYLYGIGPRVYGTVGDVPVVADYNGDGQADIAVFRPTNSTWYIYGVGPRVYGTVGDIPVIGDYNGDGQADITVFRPTNSTWYKYGVGPSVYGAIGDIPV